MQETSGIIQLFSLFIILKGLISLINKLSVLYQYSKVSYYIIEIKL